MDIKHLSIDSFSRFDLTRVPSPCFVVDEIAVTRNLRLLKEVGDASGAQVLMALKAFSMTAIAPIVSKYLAGTCASGLYEARLARNEFGGEVTTYSAGFKACDLPEIIRLSDHLIFNSPQQHRRFSALIDAARGNGDQISLGLRVNPEHSEGWTEKYDPTAPCSRLGTPVSNLSHSDWEGIEGLHLHTLCEQGFAPLKRTWAALESKIIDILPSLKWINLGGGHHISMPDYDRAGLIALVQDIRTRFDVQVFLEPGEACALHSGILVGEILDVSENLEALDVDHFFLMQSWSEENETAILDSALWSTLPMVKENRVVNVPSDGEQFIRENIAYAHLVIDLVYEGVLNKTPAEAGNPNPLAKWLVK